MKILSPTKILLSFIFILFFNDIHAQELMYTSQAFRVYADKVVQGKYEAKAVSSNQINSNYESPANLYQSADISFKFAINGKDNEMLSGQDHHYTVNALDGFAETPVIIFGKQLNQPPGKGIFLQPNTKLKVRLDLKEVLKQFQQHGFLSF